MPVKSPDGIRESNVVTPEESGGAFVRFVTVVIVPAVMFVVLASVAVVGNVTVPAFTTGFVLIVSTSTFCVVAMVVPVRASEVVGLPTFAQSKPASPPLLTSSVRSAVVGRNAERFARLNEPTLVPTTEIESTVPVVITTLKSFAAA